MKTEYDVCVIGGGPAGLMAAGRAASAGATVIILEGNPEPGRKLLISGGGRCNFTNYQTDIHAISACYGQEGKALISPFSKFSPRDCMDFFAGLGVRHKIEAENRVFPANDRSSTILEALLNFVDESGAELRCKTRVTRINRDSAGFILDTSAGMFRSKTCIVASGGFARKDTGSDGALFPALKRLGHDIQIPDAILVPVAVRERHVADLMGVSVPDCGIRVLVRSGEGSVGHGAGGRQAQEKLVEKRRGKLLFTHFGLSGPGVLNLSGRLGELERELKGKSGSSIVLELDRFPSMSTETLEAELLQRISDHPKKLMRNLLADYLAPSFLRVIPREASELLDRKAAELPKTGRRLLVQTIKGLRFHYRGRLSAEEAIVARGGVPVNEVDFRTMESKRVPGLYFAGDVLDINRPSGGYSLQICWSTGWICGETAALGAIGSEGK